MCAKPKMDATHALDPLAKRGTERKWKYNVKKKTDMFVREKNKRIFFENCSISTASSGGSSSSQASRIGGRPKKGGFCENQFLHYAAFMKLAES